ncbi:integral membrane sensor signal transduction histidine kinase [Haloterrigena turkmenica DSM 5511]|uniref:histidine kinase n=1 Tax=Haloterrigena turkmenica (strain ATCC 51198 / DSM 5511 / JCM 9101 / NCIMB 13204 / VKM B-1734 / 4k) TaxID=543526 RepID=D2RVV7_HALTV|nr:histidine kinase dimerization/phospho-acceptor domain-containing protein [Haloterrigena turkmenica]ADB61386.1 integral membrane sensor signal transduction histidine kinase [Haloterrigena turkmenica DSM 5511]
MTDSGPPEGEREGDPERSFVSRVARSVVLGVVRRSYALKLALALFVVVLLIAGIGAVSYVQIQGIIEADAEETLRSTATIQSDAVGEWVNGIESQTRGIATSDVYGTRDREAIRDHLRDSQALAGEDVVGVHYVDPESDEIVASTDSDYEGESVATAVPAWSDPIERATAEDGDDGLIAPSDRAYERNGRLLMAFAGPVRVGDGVLVVVADVRQGFEQLYRSETITTTRVLTADGREVAAPRQIRPTPLSDSSAFEIARDGKTAIHDRESDVLAFAPVDGTDWIVVAEAPKTRLYEAGETVGRNVAFLAVASLAALAVVGLVVGRGTVLPLIRLRERTRALEAGEFDVDLRTDREDEIGRLFTSFAAMRDTLRTQIRETEAARERAERSSRKLARQNERLDQFASTVSHDLRNPLNVADGYRDLLESKLADAESEDVDLEELREYATRIDESHARMETIIDDVLALAREENTIDDTVSVDLESIATDAWATVDHEDATLSVVGSRTFEADRDRLLRVFENLFRNSMEHGTTSAASRTEHPVVQQGGPSVSLEVGPTETGFYVADDGPGIPTDAVNDVFEYGATTAEDGTGFGLAIVESIVSAHDWTIAVDESHDDGAKFVVSDVGDE